MLKTVFCILYFLVAFLFYRTFSSALDKIKGDYEIKNRELSRKDFNRFCDAVFIFYMIFWPIFILQMFLRTKKRRK